MARLALLVAAVNMTLWLLGCESGVKHGLSNGTYIGSAGQVLTISGDEFTCSYSIGYTVGTSNNPTAAAIQTLSSGSDLDLASSSCAATSGNREVGCSVMLARDASRANDKDDPSARQGVQSLQIGPNQWDRLDVGTSRTYHFHALVTGDTGGVIEVARPSAPPGWSLRLGDAAGTQDVIDTDGDGTPDLGYVAPGESIWFSLDVSSPSSMFGDTAVLRSRTFQIAGHLGSNPLVADTAVLNLTPVDSGTFSGSFITNGDSVIFTTTHYNGEPIGGRYSATFDFVSNTNSFILSNMRNLIDGGCGITPDMYTKGN